MSHSITREIPSVIDTLIEAEEAKCKIIRRTVNAQSHRIESRRAMGSAVAWPCSLEERKVLIAAAIQCRSNLKLLREERARLAVRRDTISRVKAIMSEHDIRVEDLV
jgi:hypothetical protein